MHYTLHMTSRCNLRCTYCYVKDNKNDDGNKGKDMTPEIAFAAVDMAGQIAGGTGGGARQIAGGTRQNSSGTGLIVDKSESVKKAGLIFFGGEPLLLKELIYDTVAYAREKEKKGGCRYFFKATTNGILLDDKFLDFAQRENFFIALSIDGLEKAHDMHRCSVNGDGSYKQVEETAKRLLARKPYSPALMTVRPDTLSQYAAGVQSLFELGFSYVIPSLDYSADWKEQDLPELERQYELLADLYERKTQKEEKFYFSPFEVKISSHVNNRTYCHERCELGLRQLSVGPDGTIYPCVQFVGDDQFKFGSVYTGIDEEVRRALYHRNEEEKPGCAECAIRTRCNHYCACLNRQATGSIDEISPMLCAHERILLPIVDRTAERLYRQSPLFIQKHYNEFYTFASLAEDRLS